MEKDMSDTSKLNMAAMKAAAKSLGIKLPKGDPSSAASVIDKHMQENYEKSALAECGNCHYTSNIEFTSCPFCGVELGDAKEVNKAPAKTEEDGKEKKTKEPKGDGEQKVHKKQKKEEEAIVPPTPEEIAECDLHLSKIRQYKQNMAEKAYDIGIEIKEIHDKNLWKAKGHKSFSQFCSVELEYTRVMAYKYMAMTGFEREEAIMLGPSKADMITQAPKPKQKKLMEMASEGKSRKEMQEYLDKGKQNTSDKASENKITLVGRVKEGSLSMKWVGDKSGRLTNRETKGKYTSVELVTGVLLTIRELQDGSGLSLTFSRTNDDEKKDEKDEKKDSE
jgi:hypothetical protein